MLFCTAHRRVIRNVINKHGIEMKREKQKGKKFIEIVKNNL